MTEHDTAKTDTFVDRAGWPAGPWDDEPDRIEWHDQQTGLVCLALRHARYGSWCGYVAVPPGHCWHGANPAPLDVDVHGELTFGGPCMDDDRPTVEQVCHVPAPGEPGDVWWLGFDCNHCYDYAPGLAAVLGIEAPAWTAYRPAGYVIEQCGALAQQIALAGADR